MKKIIPLVLIPFLGFSSASALADSAPKYTPNHIAAVADKSPLLTIEHQSGSAKVAQKPSRVVLFDFGVYDTMNKLGLAANIVKLLAALDGVPAEQRQAHFNCVLVYMRHENDPTPIICHGRWAGVIAEQAQGEGGFGYDPVFWLPELNKTAAQLRPEEKQAMSHRGKALALLSEALRNG